MDPDKRHALRDQATVRVVTHIGSGKGSGTIQGRWVIRGGECMVCCHYLAWSSSNKVGCSMKSRLSVIESNDSPLSELVHLISLF